MFELVILLLLGVELYDSKVMFYERFDDERYALRWQKSISNLDKQGTVHVTNAIGNIKAMGLKTEDGYRYYLLSRKMKRRYTNKNRTLVVQLQVMFPTMMECGGAYIKVLGYDFEPTTFSSKTPYKIMFGPDICGYSIRDRDVKVILNYQGKYYMINQLIRFEVSYYPQLFTLIIRPDSTYEVLVNMSVKAKGSIGRDFRMIRPKKIRDKSVKPPKDWARYERIFDDSVKPPPHVPRPKYIVNPKFFENSTLFNPYLGLPYIANPDYTKLWHPPIIKNPKWKGKWKYPLIKNPRYNPVDDFYLQNDIGGVGIDIWQMTSGVIYDSILITDNEQFAKEEAKENWKRILDLAAAEEAALNRKNVTEEDYPESEEEKSSDMSVELDNSGQYVCFNMIDYYKRVIFQDFRSSLRDEIRSIEAQQFKENMKYQFGLLPKVSIFDPRFMQIMKNKQKPPEEDFSLEKRLKILQKRKLSETVEYIIKNSLY